MNNNKFIVFIFVLLIFFISSGIRLKSQAQDFESENKPLFVDISADWCFACEMIEPIFEKLKALYSSQVTFIKLDVTSEETIQESARIAELYGISTFFNSRGPIPAIGIFCEGKTAPDEILIGARREEDYKVKIESLSTKICTQGGKPPIAIDGPERPQEPTIEKIAGGRPDSPSLLDRPKEAVSSGRPPELSFWSVGQQIPYYAYFQFLVLPKCSDGSPICFNQTELDSSSNKGPVFKPYDPNATRNEKGFNAIVKKDG